MKSVILTGLICLSLFTFKVSAQAKLPVFRIADVKGRYHQIRQPLSGRTLLLIYFSPDCENCRAFVAKLVKDNQVFTRYQVVMVTDASLESLKQFVSEFHLTHKKGLVIGTEGWTEELSAKLKIQRFPYAGLYAANGTLLHEFSNPDDLFKDKW